MSDPTKRITVNAADNSVTVRLRNVRLSFPALFKPRAFSDEQEPKYSAVFIMPKTGDKEDNAKLVQQAVAEVVKMGLKGKHPGQDKVCLRDGAAKAETDGYGPDIMFVSSANARKVPVVDRDLTPLTDEDGRPYAGCRVNATIRLWPQDNKWGKRVNAQLRAVQFFGDDEPFGDSGADATEEFEKVDGDML